MAVLLIGGNGNVGKGLCITKEGSNFIPTSRNKIKGIRNLDPLVLDDVKSTLDSDNFEAVILLSACSKLDFCEKNPHESWRINVEMPAQIAKLLGHLGYKFITFSTEYIYDGRINYPKSESSQNISPISRYAYQKLIMEKYVLESNGESLILRLPKVYNHQHHGNLLTQSVLSLYKHTEKAGFLAVDQIFTPLSCTSLASILMDSIRLGISGIFNCGGCDIVSRYNFVKLIADELEIPFFFKPNQLYTITGDKMLPNNTSMNSTALYQLIGYKPHGIVEYVKKNKEVLKCLMSKT